MQWLTRLATSLTLAAAISGCGDKPNLEELTYSNRIFTTPQQAARFEANGGTKELAKKLTAVKDSRGHPLLTGDALAEYVGLVTKPNVNELRTLASYRNHNGKRMFRNGDTLVSCLEYGYTPTDLITVLDLENNNGDRVFTRRRNVVAAAEAARDVSFLEQLVTLKHEGKPIYWDGRSMTSFASNNGTGEYAKRMAQHVSTGSGIAMCWNRGIMEADFTTVDTERPNAVVLLPGDDGDGVYGLPRSEDTFYVEHRLRGEYDIWIGVMGTQGEETAYQLAESVPNIEFLDVGGHSDDWGMIVNQRLVDQGDERGYLTVDDHELGRLFTNMTPTGRAFLEGCATNFGKGHTFAQFAAQKANGRKLYVANDSFEDTGITLLSAVPFDIRIADENGRDITAILNK